MSKVKLANFDIRAEMKSTGVTLWQIADALRVCEMTVTRKFRREMDSSAKAEMLALIAKIAAQETGVHTDADN
jgi:hypothetical protein